MGTGGVWTQSWTRELRDLLSVRGAVGLPELTPLPVKPPRRPRGPVEAGAEPGALTL